MVRSGKISQRQASIKYGIPRTTLCDKLSGRVPEGKASPGPPTVLTRAEEDVLVNYVKLMASIGYPVSREELLVEVKRIIEGDGRPNRFNNNKPGKHWFYAFKRRHPYVSEYLPMSLGHQRAFASMDTIEGWYAGLFRYLKEEVPQYEGMVTDPGRIFSAGESGFPLCLKTGKIQAPTDSARHHAATSNKQQITVMVCFNASGDYAPPFIVYPGSGSPASGLADSPGTISGHSASGLMDSELFVAFLQEFSKYVDGKSISKPVLLFVEGNATQMSRNAAQFCAENGIILYCLLPSATRVSQPCDAGLFSAMKSAWVMNVELWQMEKSGETLTKTDFPKVFTAAWDSVANQEIAERGFRCSGLFPLDPSGVDTNYLGPSQLVNPV